MPERRAPRCHRGRRGRQAEGEQPHRAKARAGEGPFIRGIQQGRFFGAAAQHFRLRAQGAVREGKNHALRPIRRDSEVEILSFFWCGDMAKAVVFDMNGVFVEPIELPILRRICNETRAGEWVGLSNYYLNIAQFELGYMPPKDFWKKVFPALTDEEYKEYAEAEYEKGFQRDDALYSICSVLAKECSLYCLSNSNFMQGKAYRKQKLYSPFA